MKTAKRNISFRISDGLLNELQRKANSLTLSGSSVEKLNLYSRTSVILQILEKELMPVQTDDQSKEAEVV